ncbi:MAG: hypothetical protein FJ318_10240, partial [SAR202 cluster bacterium]|nr:hypothetical protein [SAR202 cluster bacterium]
MPGVDLESLIRAVGYIGLFAIVFAESGLLIGFFLPGDSLLFTAGFLASQGLLNIWVLLPLLFIAAVTGDAVGYAFGSRVGRRLFQREDSRFFKRKYLLQAAAFFEKHGGKAIVVARFVPIVRTLTPIVAGAAQMTYPRFAMFNVLGALLWAVGVTLAGYLLGNVIPHAEEYLLPIVLIIVLVSFTPPAIHMWREKGAEIKAWLRPHPGFVAAGVTAIAAFGAAGLLALAFMFSPDLFGESGLVDGTADGGAFRRGVSWLAGLPVVAAAA